MEAPAPAPVLTSNAPWPPELVPALVAWLSLPHEDGAELIGGRIVRKAMGTTAHGGAQFGVAGQLFRFQGPLGPGSRWWLVNETDMFLGGEGLRPDIAGWRIERHPELPARVNLADHLGVVVTPPDWVCEVLSPSTASRDRIQEARPSSARSDRGAKWRAFHRAGVEWYWVVDVQNRSLTVYQRTARSYELVETAEDGDVQRFPPFEDVEFALAPLFLGRPPH